MPSMTAPLFGPSVMVTSMVFGDLDGSIFCVPTWTTLSPILRVCLSPSKVTMNSFRSLAGSFLPPVSLDSIVQVPWNFLSSFSTSALSSARAPVPPDAVSTRVQSIVTSAIRIRVLLHLHLTTMCCRTIKFTCPRLKWPVRGPRQRTWDCQTSWPRVGRNGWFGGDPTCSDSILTYRATPSFQNPSYLPRTRARLPTTGGSRPDAAEDRSPQPTPLPNDQRCHLKP